MTAADFALQALGAFGVFAASLYGSVVLTAIVVGLIGRDQ